MFNYNTPTICSNIANPLKLVFYYKKFNQHKVTTNWKNYVPWHVPQKSVSFSRPDFKIFPLQFPWFQSCASTSAPLATDNQPGESLESKITFSLVHVGMINLRFSIFLLILPFSLLNWTGNYSEKSIVLASAFGSKIV